MRVGGVERGAGNAVGVDGGAGDVKRGKLEVGTKSERKRLGRGFKRVEPQANVKKQVGTADSRR